MKIDDRASFSRSYIKLLIAGLLSSAILGATIGFAPAVSAQIQSSESVAGEDPTQEGTGLNPFDLWHRLRFMRKDQEVFQQEQAENLNSEVSDFRARQLEQLRQQGIIGSDVPVPDAADISVSEPNGSELAVPEEPILETEIEVVEVEESAEADVQ